MDVVDDLGNDILKLLAREVRFKLRRLTLRTGRLERRQWAVKQRANLSNRGGSLLIARVAQLALLGDGVYEDRQAVAQVVEDDQHVAAHQRHVGQAELITVGLSERLNRADEVIAEVADEPAGKWRQMVERSLAEPIEHCGRDCVGVAAVG